MRSRHRLWVALLAPLALAGCERGREAEREPGRAADEPPAEAPPAAGAESTDEAGFAGLLAVTFDDLPWVGPVPPGETRVEATRALLARLRERGVTATGFVDCARVEPGAPVLRLWLDAGMRLGNHTSNHVDLDRAGAAAWAAAAARCDAFLRELTGDSVVAFRYPYLHRGRTRELHAAGRAALDSIGAPVAPVTIDTGDWLLSAAYSAALREGGEALARRIGEALVEHVARAAAHYREVAREKAGRDVAHVLLLHANALNSDWVGEVLDRLLADGFRFVPLEAALEDPIYDLRDDYIGPEGLSWLYRMEPATPEMAAWDDREQARLRESFPR